MDGFGAVNIAVTTDLAKTANALLDQVRELGSVSIFYIPAASIFAEVANILLDQLWEMCIFSLSIFTANKFARVASIHSDQVWKLDSFSTFPNFTASCFAEATN